MAPSAINSLTREYTAKGLSTFRNGVQKTKTTFIHGNCTGSDSDGLERTRTLGWRVSAVDDVRWNHRLWPPQLWHSVVVAHYQVSVIADAGKLHTHMTRLCGSIRCIRVYKTRATSSHYEQQPQQKTKLTFHTAVSNNTQSCLLTSC